MPRVDREHVIQHEPLICYASAVSAAPTIVAERLDKSLLVAPVVVEQRVEQRRVGRAAQNHVRLHPLELQAAQRQRSGHPFQPLAVDVSLLLLSPFFVPHATPVGSCPDCSYASARTRAARRRSSARPGRSYVPAAPRRYISTQASVSRHTAVFTALSVRKSTGRMTTGRASAQRDASARCSAA